ncbi:MAG: aminotransferase class V-fold PLP-dependent enzyme [Actinobacteria bacterium]|nr:aminotransferase class V-fold PLP-dependent enzyme [Actinomycetota bacterium]
MSLLPDAYLDEFSEPAGYVNYASIGPVSRRVRSVVDALLAEIASAEGALADAILPRYEEAVGAIAGFMGVPATHATPLPMTSAGLFQVAFGLLGSGGNVVVPAGEFPANVYPWLRAAEAGGPEVRWVEAPGGRLTPDVVAAAVDGATRAVALSLVGFETGFRADLDGMREAAGDALLVVDAIQGLGAVHRGIGPADVMVAGGQKWMRAGWGSGVMAVSDRALDRLSPALCGWLGVEEPMATAVPPPHPAAAGAGRYQEGTPPIVGAFQFAAAVEVAGLAGIEAISTVVHHRVAELEQVLRRAGADIRAPWASPAERAGILCFRLPGAEPAATTAHLLDAGLIVSHRGDWVRLSPHATTPPEAAGMLAEALGVPA